MNMDFSRLHTYTPPQCAPENTGYTYSLSSSYSTAALEFEKEHKLGPVYDSPRMSRRSLRLHTMGGLYGNSSVTESSQNHSVSYSSSTSSSRRSVRSRKHQAGSSSVSQGEGGTAQHSTVQQRLSFSADTPTSGTVLSSQKASARCSLTEHSYLGLEQNAELKSWSKMSVRSSLPLNGSTSKTEIHRTENGYICQNCSSHSEREEDLAGSSSLSSATASQSADLVDASSSISTVYSLDKQRRTKTGLLASVSATCVRYSRWLLTSVVSVMAFLFQNVFHLGHQATSPERKGVLLSVSDSVRAVCSWLVARGTMLKQRAFRRIRFRANDYHSSAHSSYCSSVNMKDLVTRDDHMDLNSSLCDDCKGKQYLETHTTHTHSSRTRCLLAALWSLVAYTGHGVQQASRGVALAGAFVIQKLLSVLWLAILSPGQAMTRVFWWLGTAWYQLVTLMSLFNVFILTRCFPKLLRLLLFLLPFLLLLGLWCLGLSRVVGFLPVINVTEWREKISALTPVSPFFSLPTLLPATSYNSEHASQMERHSVPVTSQPVAASVDSERLARLEQSVAALWESVQQRAQQTAQQHGEAVELIRALQEQINTQTDKETLGLWVSQLLEPKLNMLRGEMERQASDRVQTQELNVEQQKVHADRLAQLEVLLHTLASKTEEVYQRQKDPPAPAPIDVGVTQEDRDALLAEVQRLEADLGLIRTDLQGVMGCQGKCGQFDTLRETVSTQVREELYALFYGSEMPSSREAKLPENLLQWLSSQYMSSSDLHATLATLERSILGNVAVQLEQSRHQSRAEAVSQTVAHTAAAVGMTEEQVQLIVQNALRLYSQDRTGLVDYALESGGGSILSTRCSETYETKTALMSLFGVPLWYFSQSPRVVIQPDMYPGNCWAFKGSQGYLVIRLSLSVVPTSFCLEHIPKALSPTGNISSAPHHFRVYGLDDEYQEEGKLLGDYTYQDDGESLQTFPVVENNDKPFQIIELRVLSNWGHPEYTCLYRFRVHGIPSIK